ncbi:hypothetical protein CXG45_21475 [Pseudomonas plecoglossicida]|uniref:Uncharacterized protein n=1 Tax=Pseudomonas plecoglossicida TaxID=70775 RepID=A0ABX4U661_PSEDL|nr:hypothetical protein CXG44_22370 [Pseudomonas plecoglossicida]QKK97206.1 hypothetical protein GEV38_15085 [Pseudomonas sp. 13159349]TXI04687.1 MAG: hypothetical protein E6Q70_12650 [Pseudomonas monteilii]UPK86197.1 hypothetical protein E5221_15000 [Pseudomonas sp. A2]PLU90836.1 hypothetical protein CXG45_21475 [Pseudomonas plecoglossicida]
MWRQPDKPKTEWERACPRRAQRGVWHRLRRCSRRFDASTRPLPQALFAATAPRWRQSTATDTGAALRLVP